MSKTNTIEVNSTVYNNSNARLGTYVVDQLLGTVQVIHEDGMATVTWEDGTGSVLPIRHLTRVG